MTLDQCKELRKEEFKTYGDYDHDYLIYRVDGDYMILADYEVRDFYPDAEYICLK